MTSVVVIGGGAAGISAARTLLAAGCHVTMLEAAKALGGNCFGVAIRGAAGGMHTIDAGVSDFNRTTFPRCVRLFAELGLATQPIGTDASFATVHGRSVACCRGGRWQLAADVADTATFAAEVDNFRQRATEVLDDDRFAAWTVGQYLRHIGASDAFRSVYLLPRAMGCFPSPSGRPEDTSVRGLVEFWRMHGVVGTAIGDRHCIVGGMHRYPAAFAHWFTARGGELHCGARVLGVVRHRTRVAVRYTDDRARHHRLHADHVVFANHARDALPLLTDAFEPEVTALAGFPLQRARVVVHHDDRLVGDDRSTWGAFHYVIPAGELPSVRPTITFFPKELARLPASVPDVFVTMNPHRAIDPDRIVVERTFSHPVLSAQHHAATARLALLQGLRRTWFAGSFTQNPFVHENAIGSGERIAAAILRDAERVPPAQRATAAIDSLIRNRAGTLRRQARTCRSSPPKVKPIGASTTCLLPAATRPAT